MPNKLNWISQIKFLCFDVDGTLYRTVPALWDAIKGKILSKVIELRKSSEPEAQKYVDDRFKILGSSTKVLAELGIDSQDFFIRAFSSVNVNKYISPDKKLETLINKLRQKYIVGILSNGDINSVIRKITAVGLSPKLFSPLVATYEFGVVKPDPAPFLKVIEAAGVRPEESVYIGDREETDILGAKAVGMRTIMVWGESREADLSIPKIYDLEKTFLLS
ncbi:MAG: HAD hydrolase, family IA, variant 1 [Candidatus Magasanikbacteria bacterium GW2011_GWA2_45_39]|uniref:HAD hydrolase, family IA, variant 1 n=1 Tax=Candidatus Magasanikbacteria bacterium GW2011_GWA2_45_39 TaxID=1619041 RepID=A0A0G1ME28_9BACT|nr:MAG: HAD hydrolase, family IA, variant 1 [Candidatus Magasanikbacteria bacterium GW2011_GWA2_45_39]